VFIVSVFDILNLMENKFIIKCRLVKIVI